jgi:WhiB family redox-sensing transcriptional regulator
VTDRSPGFPFAALRPLEADWSWQRAALCRTSDPELFFNPENERGKARRVRQLRAKQVCAQCPVLLDCRTSALRSRESFGVWGGMSEDERNAVLHAAGVRPLGWSRKGRHDDNAVRTSR